MYKNHGNISNALDYYQKRLNIYEVIDDKQGIATSYNNILSLCESQGDTHQALEYDQKSLKIWISLQMMGNFPQAIEYYNKSLKIQNEIGDKRLNIRWLHFVYPPPLYSELRC
ncbi:MAG: tetratricopeptide repeat protein [Chitinophagaceae bacterium]